MDDVGQERDGERGAARAYLAVSGRVDATEPFVRNLMAAAWARRVLYNAAIDPHVPFAEGVAHRIALSNALKEGTAEPVEPARSATFLPVPRPLDLCPFLTSLRAKHTELARWPATMLRLAIDEACRARARHVKDCIEAKLDGRRLPKLRFRSAADDVDVSTESLRLLRCGDGDAVTKPKRGSRHAEARRRRKAALRARREAAWAERRSANGMTEARIAAGLRERAERQERDRRVQALRQARCVQEQDERKAEGTPRPPRRDSPTATVGATRVKVKVQGLGRVRVRLSRPIPEGAEIVHLHLVKEAGHGSRVEARLVLSIPATAPAHDELATGAAIHAVVRALPEGASPLAAVEAVEAAGIPVRGNDWNVSAPNADHRGRTTPRVAIRKDELVALRDLQRDLSRKDRLTLDKAAKATSPGPVTAEGTPKGRKKPPRRSRKAQKVRTRIARIRRRLADRATTRACQDARRLVEGMVLVATDPQRMARSLLAKGGPAERRAKANAVKADAAKVGGLAAPLPTEARPPRGWCLTPAQQRSLRRNMHMARPGFRVRRVALLCGAAGVVHATPGHEGTSRTCPRCEAVEAKDLRQREHACGRCGLAMPRDQASALVTLGRALLEFRESPDPGGRMAARQAGLAEAAAKAALLRERRVAAGRKTGEARRLRAQSRVQSAGATPAGGACAPPLQGVVPLCPGSPGRNIGGVAAVRDLRNSN